jgi:tetratricopeptide (TPR) repeat protein
MRNEAGVKGVVPVQILGWALSVAFLATPPAFAQSRLHPPADLDLLTRSTLAEAAGQPDVAIAWAESLARLEPTSAFALARVAVLHENIGQDVDALVWGERALAQDSTNVDAAMLVGRMRLRSGDAPGAVQVLTPPLRQLGAPPELYGLRALAHELARNYEAALADLKRTDILLPDFAWIATGTLSLALEDERLEEAKQALELALELRPDDPRVLTLGVRYAREAGDAPLQETLLRALALHSEARAADVAAYAAFLHLAGKKETLAQLVRWAGARGIPEATLRLDTAQQLFHAGRNREAVDLVKPISGDPRATALRARAAVSMGNEGEALAQYRRLLPTASVSREESLVVAYLEIREGSVRRGVALLETARSHGFDTPRQVLAASLCYALLGHPGEAVSLIRESAARGIESPPLYQELGSAAASLGDRLLAQWAFERLVESGQETSECLTFLATTDLARGKTDRAIASLDRALQLDPKNGKALLLLGKVRWQRGQLELARSLLRRAADRPETSLQANELLAEVCRSLRLDSEAREAEARARANRSRPSAPGLSLFIGR